MRQVATRAATGMRDRCRRRSMPSEESLHLPCNQVKVDVVDTGSGGQAGHGAHLGDRAAHYTAV